MGTIKRIVFIEDFEKPQSCWDCPMLKSAQEKMYCGLLGETNGQLRKYSDGFRRDDCKLRELAFEDTSDNE